MPYYCAHRGTFQGLGPSVKSPVDWMVELWRPYKIGTQPPAVGNLVFPHDSPLTIEWEEWKPEVAVQGAMLTLKVISITDREFIDYYTTQAASIVIKVYRRDRIAKTWQFIWRGTLDPEFYEEPYECNSGYDVTMTFSDFGALDRLSFDPYRNRSGIADARETVVQLLGYALMQGQLIDNDEYWSDYELFVYSGAKLLDMGGNEFQLGEYPWDWEQDVPPPPAKKTCLRKLMIDQGNFLDEEGNADSYREVIEALLKPLGLHIVQRGGTFFIYDTDYLAGNFENPEGPYVHWSADSQTLGTAETYNNIKITFSPYSKPVLLSDKVEIDPGAQYRSDKIVGSCKHLALGPGKVRTYSSMPSFRLTRTSSGKGAEKVYGECPYFKITPLFGSATECSGYIFSHTPRFRGNPVYDPASYQDRDLIKFAPFYVPAKTGEAYLLLTMDMLFDPRFNFYEPADTGNDETDNNKAYWDDYTRLAGWITVPLRIVLRNNAGQITHYFTNSLPMLKAHGSSDTRVTGPFYPGVWMPYNVPEGMTPGQVTSDKCWMQWYADSQGEPALNGWTKNRATIGIWPWVEDLSEYYKKGPDGMLIAYPPQGGYIEIYVLDGVLTHRRGTYVSGHWTMNESWPKDSDGNLLRPTEAVLTQDLTKVTNRCKWWGYKDVKLTIVGTEGGYHEVASDDIVIEGTIDEDAREELSFDTKCGTTRDPKCGMRGLYHLGSSPVWSMKKANIHTYVERMLIGSLYSQYGRRRTVLSGEAIENVAVPAPVWNEQNTPGLFIISRSSLDAIAGTEDLTLTRIYSDHFVAEPIEGLKYEDFDEPWDPRHDEPEFDSGQSSPWDPDDIDPDEPFDPGDVPDPWDDDDPYWADRFEYDDRDE